MFCDLVSNGLSPLLNVVDLGFSLKQNVLRCAEHMIQWNIWMKEREEAKDEILLWLREPQWSSSMIFLFWEKTTTKKKPKQTTTTSVTNTM